ncbi:hypothetical protein ACFL0Y_04345 [Patescibacteria group bacterium]
MAEISNPALSSTLQGYSGIQFVNRILPRVITFFFLMATVACVFFFLWGGIRWITSTDDRENLAKAQKTITNALIGLAIVFSLFAVLKMIGYFFTIDLITIDIGPLIL